MRWVLSYLYPLRGRIAVGITVKTIGTVTELMIPFLLSYILEHVIVKNEAGGFVLYGALMAICALLACLGNIIANRMAAKTTMIFSRRMRRDLFARTLGLSARETDAFTIPSLESRITTDTYNVQNFVGMMQRLGIRAPLLLVGGAAITLIMDARLALVMLATMPFIFALVYGISRLGVPLYTAVQRAADGMVRVVREDAQGIRVIKALSRVEYENARYDKANGELRRRESRAGIVMGAVNPFMTLLMNVGIVAVIAVSANLVASGISSATTVIAFMQYFTLISMAMMSLSRMFVMYTKCAASARRIAAVMEREGDLPTVEDDGRGDPELHIAFEGVTFSYLGKRADIREVSFALKRGQSLGIIGATGSGKSTLLRLLLRFYDADAGRVRIAGRDVRSYTREELTSMLGVVFQNDFLYADTIEENIRFGRDIPRERIEAAARVAQAHDFITAFPEGYDHRVSAGGTNLSGGQRQRVLIARAVAGDPSLLILDDASSALDYKTDAALRGALAEALPSATVITVAQRVSSVKGCNLILLFDEGAVIGAGTHEELLAASPEYREISESQMGGAFLD